MLFRIPIVPPLKEKERPWLTYGFVALLVAVYICEIAFSIDGVLRTTPNVYTLIAFGGLNKLVIANTGEWFRFLTAPFINGNIVAVVFNGAALILLGPAFEARMGSWWFAAFILMTAVICSAATFAVNPLPMTAVGTAGVLTGLSVTLFIFSFRLPYDEKLGLQIRVLDTMIFFLWPMLNGAKLHMINYGSHAGGILAGIIFGQLFSKIWSEEKDAQTGRDFAAFITVVGAVVLLGSAAIIASRYPIYARLAWLIPPHELPFSPEDKIAQSVNLIAVYPHDPRGHEYRAHQYLNDYDFGNARHELELALADAHDLYFIFGADYEAEIVREMVYVASVKGRVNSYPHLRDSPIKN